jgi:DNA-binding transcriptional ArsR family regulator
MPTCLLGQGGSQKSECGSFRATKRAKRQPSHSEVFLFSQSTISLELIQAYRETAYRVDAPEPFVLSIDQSSSHLKRLYRTHLVSSCAFITAWNPYSESLSAEENSARQTRLANDVRELALELIEGEGKHPNGLWPGEASYLVLGLTLDEAQKLGQQYQQNAILWCGAEAIPRLVLLK